MTLLLARVAFAGIRARVLASALTVVLCAAAAATIVVALEVGASTRDPWQRTFDAAHGAHVLATAPSEADARAVAALPGVAERDAPLPRAIVTTAGGDDPLALTGLEAPPRINTPVPTDGADVREGAIVLERSFARAVGIRVGDTIRLAGATGPVAVGVVGTAISPSQPRYPLSTPGLAWVTRATLTRIVPSRDRWRWTQAMRLPDPAAAPAFAARVAASSPSGAVSAESWQDQRGYALNDARTVGVIVTAYTIVLLVVVFAVVAILVAARAGQQHREIGLLKAVGFTPRQVTAAFALEFVVLGLAAVAIGFAAGVLLAPRLAAAGAATLVGAPTIAADPWHLVVAAAPILLVLLAGVRGATRRSTRFSALTALQAGTALPPPRSRLARAPLPLPLALGFKDLLARRRRAHRLAGVIAVTGAAIVFALAMQASLDARPAGEASDVSAELPVLVYTLDAVLLVITATTLIAVVLLSVRERVRDLGVLKAIGLTPRQLTSSLVGAHAALALVAALASIPLGIALYVAVYDAAGGSAEDRVLAPWWALALVPIAAPLVVAAATSLPARLATRIRTADALRYE